MCRKIFLFCVFWSAFLLCGGFEPMAWVLPEPVQRECYDLEGKRVPCPNLGDLLSNQCGSQQKVDPAFRDNGDGTVLDFTTGLVWQKSDDGLMRGWDAALSYCKKLELGCHTDWRLPERYDLVSIADSSRFSPSIHPVFDCHPDNYWSNTTYLYYPGSAWYVNFKYGYAGWNYKSYGGYVRCVREDR